MARMIVRGEAEPALLKNPRKTDSFPVRVVPLESAFALSKFPAASDFSISAVVLGSWLNLRSLVLIFDDPIQPIADSTFVAAQRITRGGLNLIRTRVRMNPAGIDYTPAMIDTS